MLWKRFKFVLFVVDFINNYHFNVNSTMFAYNYKDL
jgi:hypothetical protein